MIYKLENFCCWIFIFGKNSKIFSNINRNKAMNSKPRQYCFSTVMPLYLSRESRALVMASQIVMILCVANMLYFHKNKIKVIKFAYSFLCHKGLEFIDHPYIVAYYIKTLKASHEITTCLIMDMFISNTLSVSVQHGVRCKTIIYI